MSHLQSSVWPAVADQIKSRSVGAVKGNLHNLTDETSNINGVAQPKLNSRGPLATASFFA